MNFIMARQDHLAVVDQRSRFTSVAMGWRTDPASQGTGVSQLRCAVSSTTEMTGTGLVPVSVDWTVSDGAHCLTAILPETITRSWIETVIHRARTEAQGIAGDPVLAVVGSPSVLEDLAGIMAGLGGDLPPARQGVFPSTMRRSTVQGFEQTIVIGQDPVEDVGRAAAFLAICLIAGGPGTLLFDAVHGSGHSAHLQAGRGLQDGCPTVTWQVIAPGHSGIAVLETALSTVSAFRIAEHPDAVRQAREFARGNLTRAWRSPIQLARSLAQYEVMGWGGELILDPAAALDHVDTNAIEHAVDGLVRPIKDVLART